MSQAPCQTLRPLCGEEHIVEELAWRLSISEQMEATVEMNLERTESLQQSILRLAFGGRLVRPETAANMELTRTRSLSFR